MRTRRFLGATLGWVGLIWLGLVFLAWVLGGWFGLISLPGLFDALWPGFWTPGAILGRVLTGLAFFVSLAPGVGALALAGRVMASPGSPGRR